MRSAAIQRGSRRAPTSVLSRLPRGRGRVGRWLVPLVIAAVVLVLFGLASDRADPGPSISRLSSTTGPTAGGIEVVITGRDFTASPAVTFGGVPAKIRSSTPHRIVVVTPVRAAGSVSVIVKTSDGPSRSSRFTYLAAPTIRSVSPASGTAKGGTSVTIHGTGFSKGSTVTFGKTPGTRVTVRTPTTITVTSPKHTYETAAVQVTTPYGASASSHDARFQYGTKAERRLAVGSFNVRVASGYYKMRESRLERPWASRLPAVADQIRSEGLDVVGIQEASASAKHTVTHRSQYRDIVAALGSPYRLTNSQRHCAGSGVGARCRNGGSSSDRIIYNSDRLKLLAQGARKLDGRSAGSGSGRYVVWARFRDLRTGKVFYFFSTHLEPGKSSGTRRRQAAIIVNEVNARNTKHLPTILVGDLGASKFGNNAAHGVLTGAGFLDPLVNTSNYHGSKTPVAKLVNTRLNSLNNFRAAPVTKGGFPIGSYLDYILVRGGTFDLAEWKTVVNVDSRGRFKGVIPSDHNLVKLTLSLP